MKTSTKISIVMPVYNTPKTYLLESVNSVLSQQYNNIELIIVDDGSNSECAMVCDSIRLSDPRVVVLHQTNSGVSGARNHGTLVATGDYIMYMDSDDFLGTYALTEGISVIQQTDTDFIFAALQHVKCFQDFVNKKSNGTDQYVLYMKEQIDDVRHSFFTQRNPLYNNIQGVGFVNRGPCARLVKTNIAQQVSFNEKLKIGEDVEWNMRLLNVCNTVVFVPSIWYGYLIYEGSSLRKYYGNRAELLAMYHDELYTNNSEYCNRHPDDYALNMVVSFYSMVQFEYLSPSCPLSWAETNKEIGRILQRKPWNILMDKACSSCFPLRYRVFLIMCKYEVGATFLKLWEGMTGWKKKLR